MSQGRTAALSVGSNLGDRAGHLAAAVDGLRRAEGVRIEAVSPVYETPPVGTTGHPAYLNAVVLVTTTLTARELLETAQALEAAQGRVRLERWGPRTLDIDVLAVADEVSEDPVVLLPHPRAHTRAFVLVPWADVDPRALVPGHGTVAELLATLPDADVTEVRAGLLGPLLQAEAP